MLQILIGNAAQSNYQNGRILQNKGSRIPLGRLAEVTDIAEVVAFLSSEESYYIDGCSIVISGGRIIY